MKTNPQMLNIARKYLKPVILDQLTATNHYYIKALIDDIDAARKSNTGHYIIPASYAKDGADHLIPFN